MASLSTSIQPINNSQTQIHQQTHAQMAAPPSQPHPSESYQPTAMPIMQMLRQNSSTHWSGTLCNFHLTM